LIEAGAARHARFDSDRVRSCKSTAILIRVSRKPDGKCICGCGKDRASVPANEHIVFICAESVPHEVRGERSTKSKREMAKREPPYCRRIGGQPTGHQFPGQPPRLQCDPISTGRSERVSRPLGPHCRWRACFCGVLPGSLSHFLKRAHFDLADAFTRHVEFHREIFQRRWFIGQTTRFEDATFPVG
jgi:hypothetical protein